MLMLMMFVCWTLIATESFLSQTNDLIWLPLTLNDDEGDDHDDDVDDDVDDDDQLESEACFPSSAPPPAQGWAGHTDTEPDK